MDANLRQEILRTIVRNENRMSTPALGKAIREAGFEIVAKDLLDLEFEQTLCFVDGNWIVQRWWEVKLGSNFEENAERDKASEARERVLALHPELRGPKP